MLKIKKWDLRDFSVSVCDYKKIATAHLLLQVKEALALVEPELHTLAEEKSCMKHGM